MKWEQGLRRAMLLTAGTALALMALGILFLFGLGWAHLRTLPVSGSAITVMGGALLISAFVAAGGAFAVSLVLAGRLAHALSRRAVAVTRWSRHLGTPEGDRGLAVDRSDEIGELAYALRQAHRRLRATATAQRTLLAAVAHDLRTPLSSLRGQLEGMMTGLLQATPERLAGLHADAGRLVRLTNDLLLLFEAESQGLTLQRRSTDLGAWTRNLVERMAPISELRSIRLRYEGPDQVFGTIDSDRMDQVLTNVIGNALTYCPSDSHVTVQLETSHGYAAWAVVDDGPGIPLAVRDQVTEAFVRGDASRQPGHVGLGIL